MHADYRALALIICFITVASAQVKFKEQKITDLPDTVISVVNCDLDSDGDTDIIYWPDNDDKIFWLENNGNDNFNRHFLEDSARNIQSVITADLDKDSYIDLILSYKNSTQIIWYENNGTQKFFAHIVSNNADSASNILVTDLDKDNDMDILSFNKNIIWYENNGQHFITDTISEQVGNTRRSVKITDINNDGDNDIFDNHLRGSLPEGPLNAYFVILQNNGFQIFTMDTIFTTWITLNLSQLNLRMLVDMDADKRVDVLNVAIGGDGVCSCVYGRMEWYKNTADSGFTKIGIGSSGFISALDIKDIDNDGSLDILTSTVHGWPEYSTIEWYQNDGKQNFVVDTIKNFNDSTSKPYRKFVKALDIENDGDTDIIATLQSRIVLFENDGSQNFTENILCDYVKSIEMIDMDGDGDLDIQAIFPNKLVWFENLTVTTTFDEYVQNEPQQFRLEANFPNPFNPKTRINYQLPVSGNVELSIYNLLGQKVATLVNRRQQAGNYSVEWDASDLSSGVYIYSLETDTGFKESRKLVLIK